MDVMEGRAEDSQAPATASDAASPARAVSPQLGVVLVNWNGADVTIECLESLLRSDIPLRVVVVDNGSEDGSADRIRAWARGEAPWTAPDGPLRRLSDPPLAKPVAITSITGDTAVATAPGAERLTLVEAGANLGFAGGNNVGIRHLLRDPGIMAVWLLNNDTVVEPAAARAVLATMRSDPWMGMAGTVVRFYHQPDVVQALNGSRFNVLTGQAKSIGGGQPATQAVRPVQVVDQTDFVLGASLCVSRRFVETVGLMSERYFLYFEEIDWARRNRDRFRIGFARGATVYHKHGGAIGSSSIKGGRSATSEYWMLRSRLKFYRAHHIVLLPLIWVQGVAQTGVRLLRLQPAKAAAMLKALVGGSP